ncbi:hypothetical protein SLEP1_g54799 [Rubroshorea leprosula]|uniref:Uncharacterized protein n=1 Tax=Rubroshorea leprosula TaxID=152421 RepID=A0AAV5MDJ3_9ROSI|nr:hypothetical protein SLEP1_g54799 [Rubroshorea leprosula]
MLSCCPLVGGLNASTCRHVPDRTSSNFCCLPVGSLNTGHDL